MPDNLIAMKLHFIQSAAKLKSRIFLETPLQKNLKIRPQHPIIEYYLDNL